MSDRSGIRCQKLLRSDRRYEPSTMLSDNPQHIFHCRTRLVCKLDLVLVPYVADDTAADSCSSLTYDLRPDVMPWVRQKSLIDASLQPRPSPKCNFKYSDACMYVMQLSIINDAITSLYGSSLDIAVYSYKLINNNSNSKEYQSS